MIDAYSRCWPKVYVRTYADTDVVRWPMSIAALLHDEVDDDQILIRCTLEPTLTPVLRPVTVSLAQPVEVCIKKQVGCLILISTSYMQLSTIIIFSQILLSWTSEAAISGCSSLCRVWEGFRKTLHGGAQRKRGWQISDQQVRPFISISLVAAIG